jgi:SRSO17 transposase
MEPRTGWEKRLEHWLEPFLDALGDKRRRKWAPLYVMGLLLPGERKSMQPISARVAPKDVEQIHHFVGTSCWDTAPVEEVLWRKCDELLGGESSYAIVDDTCLPKKGTESVGVAHQYCGALGKQANCQCLVSLTLTRDDIFVPVGLRLFLPQSWVNDPARCERAKVPSTTIGYRPKWRIALDEIDRIRAAGVRFACVLADAGYGTCADFRRGLSERRLQWAVGILSTQNMYENDVKVTMPKPKKVGRRRVYPLASRSPCAAERFIEQHGEFRRIVWRKGTKGALQGEFAILRVRPADGDETADGVHLPGDPAWLVCERFSNGDRKYYLVNLPASASGKRIVGTIKARWACEQGHQQMKEEFGLDHFEGRSWWGLHHHALLTMIAFAFLQTLRLEQNKSAA